MSPWRDMPRMVCTLNAPMARNSSVVSRKAASSLRWTGTRTLATQRTSAPRGPRRRKAANGSVRPSRMGVASILCHLHNPPRIMVVDDTPANVRMLQTRLERDGYEICVAHNGEEALAAARKALPDLILLDIMMPKIDGIEVCRTLKEDPAFPFTPVIMVTALSDTKDVVAGLEAGGDDYLTKPVDKQALDR